MPLTSLPEEIIIMIMQELDLKAIESMYHTCKQLRTIVCMQGVVKKCKMSMNCMATANTLKLNFFKDISGHLQELNLCGVPDLYRTSLLPAMKKLRTLKTLDVSYTHITLLDFLDVYEICPTLKNLSINFVFGKPGLTKLSQEILLRCQLVFEHFENVQFVGSENNLMYSQLASYILEKAKLKNLKYSVVECDYMYTTDENIESTKLPQFHNFSVHFLDWKNPFKCRGCNSQLPVLAMQDMNNYEFIIITLLDWNNYSIVDATPLFHKFFSEHFNVNVDSISEFKKPLTANVTMMFWNKEITEFNDHFFYKLKKDIRHYFPFTSYSPCEIPSSRELDRFYITLKPSGIVQGNEDLNKYEPQIKKRRIVAPHMVLNYDTMFKEFCKVRFSLAFLGVITGGVSLPTNCNYLRKLTFLSLSGHVRYTSNFFDILFQCCDNLITLNVHAPSISPCAASISRSIPLTNSLRNFRLVDKKISFQTLFVSLHQCSTLENIHIVEDTLSEACDLGDPSILLENCRLHNLFIEAPMTNKTCVKILQLLNKAKARFNKHYLRIMLQAKSSNNGPRYNYDPFMDVFNLTSVLSI